MAIGRVIGECMDRHRHDEYLRFLGTIDRTVPAGLDVHVIADNYATHKHADVRAWVESHPRFRMHYTPTSSAWLNQVEHWFGDLERDAIRRGVFPGLKSLVDSINRHIDAHNRSTCPYSRDHPRQGQTRQGNTQPLNHLRDRPLGSLSRTRTYAWIVSI